MNLRFSFSGARLITALILTGLCMALAVFMGSSVKFMAFAAVMFIAGGLCKVRLNDKKQGILSMVIYYGFALCASAITVVLMQKVNDITFFNSISKFALNFGIAFAFTSLLCTVYYVFAKKLSSTAIIIASALLMLMSLVNYYVYAFRGNGISPADLLTLGTAANFVGVYKYEVPRFTFHALALWTAAAFFISGVSFTPTYNAPRRIAAPALLLLVSCAMLYSPVTGGTIQSKHYGNNGCAINGLLLNFRLETKESIIKKPESYSPKSLSALEAEYSSAAESTETVKPNIIVIMNEAFSDLRVIGDLQTDVPVMPFFDSLSENTVKGFACTSAFGGTTANSEFEFLTGNSMAFLPSFSVPFQQYIVEPMFTVERYLGSLGYQSFATHPCEIENWSRYRAWPWLGFENHSFIEAYSDAELIGTAVTDSSLYSYITEQYEQMDNSRPKFIYSVSIQNHSPYTDLDEQYVDVHMQGYSSYAVDAYLSLIHRSDEALAELIAYFEKVEEPVVILMYGDHQPVLPDGFYEYLAPELSEQQLQVKKYIVPFMLWANYDIPEQQVELSSLNYLSNYLLETAGLPFSPYNNFLRDTQKILPAIYSHGYYSLSTGDFIPVSQAEGEEKAALLRYQQLQYNALFDSKQRSELFFPAES